ncbi:MAG: transposase [Verrucomicrobiota bacterium]|jgi:REP element-mobilizing transposase RayT
MPRQLRLQYPGAIYHVMNRGDRREAIFKDDRDHRLYLETLGQACEKTGWEVHAWCLMGNHFHLVIETPQANLVAGMKWLLGTYTARFNRRHKLFGHLFGGRYKALAVDGSGSGYLRTVCDYVHLNPIRAGVLGARQSLEDYRWSSFNDYLKGPGRRPVWLRTDRLFGEMGIGANNAAGRRQFEEQMEARRAQDQGQEWRKIRRGWCLGGGSFRLALLERMEGQFKEHHGGAQRQESAEKRAERMITEGLANAGWNPGDLHKHRKGDPVKVALAMRLRQETTLTLKWIAQRLHMGRWEYVRRLIYETRNGKSS